MTFLCARARISREVVRRGWISDVSPGVIKTGGAIQIISWVFAVYNPLLWTHLNCSASCRHSS